MSETSSPAQRNQNTGTLLSLLGFVGLVCALIALIGSLDGATDPIASLMATLLTFIDSVWLPLAMLGACWGYGWLGRPLFRDSPSAWVIQCACGLGVMLWVVHLLAWTGLLELAAIGPGVVSPLVAVGVALAVVPHLKSLREQLPVWKVPAAAWVCAPAIGVILLAACSTPGWLWDTEAGGYDALSYHLLLPQEWLTADAGSTRLVPLDHNVYSFLPSSMEAMFTFIAVSMDDGSAMRGLLSHNGRGLIACQLLHAGLLALASLAMFELVRREGDRAGLSEPTSRLIGGAIGAIVIATPWSIVVGTLAYNEMGVVLLGGVALLVALDDRIAPAGRGAVTGLLVGAACGCKPTALLLVAPGVAIALALRTPPQTWWRIAIVGAPVGLIMLAPWLVRNWIASGNPVFPALSSVFGIGHWTQEQIDRFADAHTSGLSADARLGLLLLPDASGTARGWMHLQWGLFFPLTIAGAVISVCVPRTRKVGLFALAGLLVGCLAWLVATHLQSRFLIPLIPIAGLLIGIGAIALVREHGPMRTRGVQIALLVFALVQTGLTVQLYSDQRGGSPSLYVGLGASILTGHDDIEPQTPAAIANQIVPEDELLYLIGEARGLYYTCRTMLNTTWDSWPIGDAIRAHPGEPEAWSAVLRDRDVAYVMINRSEVARLVGDGWADPVLTTESLNAWISSLGEPLEAWPSGGQSGQASDASPWTIALFDLRRTVAPSEESP